MSPRLGVGLWFGVKVDALGAGLKHSFNPLRIVRRSASFSRHGNELVEVFVDGEFKGAIYPNDKQTGFRFLTSHFEGEPVYGELPPDMRYWEFKWEKPREN